MRKVVVNISVSLDGVRQAPGRPDEDPRGEFGHRGWALPYTLITLRGLKRSKTRSSWTHSVRCASAISFDS
jgi:hypothetical protein